ncbi:MAG: HAD-IIIA family hydrolase [Burkholderiales bacterium]|nr:HAD-IIIA family hydrolase [Burkholderiales bacterium]
MKVKSEVRHAAIAVKLLVLDVDGVLTDGSIIIGNTGELYKRFNVKDGLGIKLLQEVGIQVAICTGRISQIVNVRAEELGIDLVLQGEKDKKEGLAKICIDLGLKAKEVAYMGDDLSDLALFSEVGIAAVPKDASSEVKEKANWVSKHKGGQGAVREFAEFILKEKGLFREAVRKRFSNTEI